MANVLVLSLVFPPDNVSTAHIMGALSKDLKNFGHNISVISTTPHYNIDTKAESNQRLSKSKMPFIRRSNYSGIDVLHIKMPKKSGNIFMRIISWMWFHILSIIISLFYPKKLDIVIAPSPPLTIGLCAFIISRFHKARYIYNVQEVYPDIAIKLGVLKNKIIIQLFYLIEKFIYSKAAFVTVISEGMKKNLLKKGVSEDKIRLIPNFVDDREMYPLSKLNNFSKQNSIYNKFVISYAGNMGISQGLDILVDAAYRLNENHDIIFLLVGDGTEKSALEEKVKAKRLNNFIILPFQNYDLVPQIYASSDLNVVSQAKGSKYNEIPSKVYRIMACASAILAITEEDSDLASLIKKAQCGYIVNPNEPEKLVNIILKAYKERKDIIEYGRNGRQFVLNGYTREAITKMYNNLLVEVTKK